MNGSTAPIRPWTRRDGVTTPTIVFAQELGAGLGHTVRLATVARAFPDARRVFVLREPDLGRPVLAAMLDDDVPCLPSPEVERPGRGGAIVQRTMADILAGLGFADARALGAATRQWRALLAAHKPDLVISDYAPTLRIAIAGAVPHIAVGNGFVVPPDVQPLPALLERETGGAGASETEATILDAANGVRRTNDRPALRRVAELLRGDATFAATLPLLDPYRGSRAGPVFRPFGEREAAVGKPARRRRGPFVFAYLDADAEAVNPVLTALNGLDVPSQVFVRGIEPAELARHCAPQVGIHQGPADLRALLPECRLVVHGGTLGTAEFALLSGTPQLLAPDTLERELTARALAAAGLGLVMRAGRDADPDHLRGIIAGLLADEVLARRARDWARQSRSLHLPAPLPAVVDAARAMLGRPAAPA